MSFEAVVLKFGSSVLCSPSDLPMVTGEINSFLRAGMRVIAVVSAFEGRTDQLIAKASAKGLTCNHPDYARLIAGGEMESATALSLALGDLGVTCRVLTPADLRLKASGTRQDASPVDVKRSVLADALNTDNVIVVPGFSAIDANGDPVLLGRGGSDLTAIFLAKALGLQTAHLLKDVDGLYTDDPNLIASAKRYSTVSWEQAAQVAGSLIQPKAIAFAQSHQIEIEIASIGGKGATRIGPYKNAFSIHAAPVTV